MTTPQKCGIPQLVAVLCLLFAGGCSQFVLYQHNDHRTHAPTAESTPEYSRKHSDGIFQSSPRAQSDRRGGRPARWFAGALAISPGLRHLAELAGDDCWVAHSAGAARAIQELLDGADPPRVLILIDPWPLRLEIPDGPELVIVVCGRPSVVTVAPGTRAVSKLRAAGSCPWAWTIGHLYACRWPESVEAAR